VAKVTITGIYDPDVPVEFTNPDFSKLEDYVLDAHKNAHQADWREPKDFEHYVYECAMEAIYGPDYWDWLNRKMDEADE